MTSLGLYIYDFLAEVEGEDKRRMLEKDEVRAIEPLLPDEKLLGGSICAEYRTDDARLTMEVIKTAYHKGACTLSYLSCKSFLVKKCVPDHFPNTMLTITLYWFFRSRSKQQIK
jgi:glycerol-3-phosphate dehydrogenase